MRENFKQSGDKGADGRTYIDGDWYDKGIPSSVNIADNAYIGTSYGFSAFYPTSESALRIGEASGCYDLAEFIVSGKGKVQVGNFTILNGSTIVCNSKITIGNHCMLAWGSVLTDCWSNIEHVHISKRREILINVSINAYRKYPFLTEAKPIIIEDNCWVGFDSVILPGVTLGRGSIVGCKSIVSEDVPSYAIVAGNPARVIKYQVPTDTDEAIKIAMTQYLK